MGHRHFGRDASRCDRAFDFSLEAVCEKGGGLQRRAVNKETTQAEKKMNQDRFAPLSPRSSMNPRYRMFSSNFQRPYADDGVRDVNPYGTTAQMFNQCMLENGIGPDDLEGRSDCMRQASLSPVPDLLGVYPR